MKSWIQLAGVKRTRQTPPDTQEKKENPRTAACWRLPASSVTALMDELVQPPAAHRNQHPPELTRKKQAQFLLLLAKTGQHVRSCAVVGISSSTPLQWAEKNEMFAKRFDEAKKKGEQVLLLAYEADLDAVVAEPLFLQHTSNLRMFRMKRLDPRYRDSVAAVQVNVGPAAIMLGVDDDQPAQKAIENASR